ncbi:MAG: hypothetical protein ACJ708_00295 [Nitrososphaeraceae archaeon]
MSVLLLLLVVLSSFVFGFTVSIFFTNSTTFGLESNWFICSSSEPDLIIIPFFFVTEPVVAFIGFISMAIDGGLFLNVGNFVEKLLVC